jgi:hypothetical protein
MENTLDPTFKHHEHHEWVQKLIFFEQEIQFFEKELERIQEANGSMPTIMGHVDEYHQIFVRKRKWMGEIRHQIERHEAELVQDPNHPTLESVQGHAEVREMMEELEANFGKLKENFRRFASRND